VLSVYDANVPLDEKCPPVRWTFQSAGYQINPNHARDRWTPEGHPRLPTRNGKTRVNRLINKDRKIGRFFAVTGLYQPVRTNLEYIAT